MEEADLPVDSEEEEEAALAVAVMVEEVADEVVEEG